MTIDQPQNGSQPIPHRLANAQVSDNWSFENGERFIASAKLKGISYAVALNWSKSQVVVYRNGSEHSRFQPLSVAVAPNQSSEKNLMRGFERELLQIENRDGEYMV